MRIVHVWRGDAIPARLEGISGLVILGGSLGVEDVGSHPHLREELAAIEVALRSGRPVLGICLGAQLIAAALGAKVARAAAPEIGWHEVELLPEVRADPLWARSPKRFTAFQWHCDAFELPAGAVRLASSAGCEVQAFRHGLAFAVQFHPEVDEPILRTMAEGGREELQRLGFAAGDILGPMATHLAPYQQIARDAFSAWASIALADTGD